MNVIIIIRTREKAKVQRKMVSLIIGLKIINIDVFKSKNLGQGVKLNIFIQRYDNVLTQFLIDVDK